MEIKKATVFMLLSSVAFTFMQLCVKMTGTYGTFEQVFLRNSIILIISSIIIKQKGLSFKVTRGKWPLLLRCVCGFLGVVFFFYSIKKLNLADASALQKSSPFFVTLFSFLILKEKITKVDISTIMVAFIGVLLVIKPNFQLTPIPSVSALMSAVFAGMAYVMISYIGEDVDSSLIIFYFSLFSCISCLPFVVKYFVVPSLYDILPLLGIGFGGGMGQLFLTMGYKLAPPGKISVYNFTSIIFSAILGYFFFQESLDRLSILGISLILMAAIAAHVKNNRLIEGGTV